MRDVARDGHGKRPPRSFYERSAVRLAPALLGCVLVRAFANGTRLAGRIVEVEAYEPGDPASHGYRGPTPRNGSMFGAPGHLYVYFTYGHHWMANVVARRAGEGSAVLLRALEPLEGLEEMAARRGRSAVLELCSGPGKLAQALGLSRIQDGSDLVGGADVWIEEGAPVPTRRIERTGRVGVSVGVDPRWRFFERGNSFVSRGRPGPPATPRSRSRPSRP